LPTEAEWEYASRGGKLSKKHKYSGSDSINDVAWYKGNTGDFKHSEVGKLNSNELGIFDMSGNVWEWCDDWYSATYYSSSPSVNPKGPNGSRIKSKRGGSWKEPPLDNSFRSFMTLYTKADFVGFRIVRNQ
jgi:formylglycine-generating enzyme